MSEEAANGSIRVRWPGGERTFPPGKTVHIGREPGSDVELEHPTVSRRHAELTYSDGRWKLRDLGSAQGTSIGGTRTDEITIAGTVTAVLGDPVSGDELELTVAADEPTVTRPSGGTSGAPGTVVADQGPARPGGALRSDVVEGATIVTGDAINVECGGRSYTFHPGAPIVIGRDEEADIVVANPTVSRRHATLQHGPTGWVLADAGSSSGTSIDGRRITTAVLTGSTAVQLGDPDTGERLVAVASGKSKRSAVARVRRNGLVLAVGVIAAVALIAALFAATGSAGGGPDDDHLARATVRVVTDLGSGSGTVIDAEKGLILTNAHVADPAAPGLDLHYGPDDPDPIESILVQVAPGLDRAAEPRFQAEVVASDGYLDMTVLKITKTARGAFIDENDLDGLVDVEIGQSDAIRSGDPINVFGYPASADSEAASLTRGVIAGSVKDDRLETNRAWLNIDTDINPGNSGGLAADDDGRIVGVPTLSRQFGQGEPVSSIRPIDLAEPLIAAARADKDYTSKVPLRPLDGEEVTSLGLGALGSEIGFESSCSDGTSATREALAISFEYRGFAEGDHQDILAAVFPEGGSTPIASWSNAEDYPSRDWEDEGCATISMATSEDLTTGSYDVVIFLGPSYEVAANESVVIR